MSEKKSNKLPFESENLAELQLWAALEGMPRQAPSADMRRGFYRKLERASAGRWSERIRGWLGFSGGAGWITASACVLLGVGMGQVLNKSGEEEPGRLAVLEQNVALLNRELILGRLQDKAAGKRLRGVIDAGNVVQNDVEIARALLLRATEDRVYSVRSAAIDALGPTLGSAAVGKELMQLLENSESPLVQLALVDLVLRNGSDSQLEQLLRLADNGRIHPDLTRHIKDSLRSETI